MAEFNYSGFGPKTVYLQGERNERTGEWEGNYPVEGIDWQMDERSGQMYAPDPNYVAPSSITPEDIKNRVPFSYDPYEGAIVVDPSANVPKDPNEYSKQLGSELSKRSYEIWSINGNPSQYTDLIEGLKEVDPKAYYTAKLDTLSRNVGHQYQSNQTARGDVAKQQLMDLLPEAQKAGVTPEEINSLYGSGYSQGAQGFAQILSNQQSQKAGFLAPFIEGVKFVGPAALGMYGIDQALIAGLGAAYGAGTGMSTVGLGSGLGGAAALDGALVAGAGSFGSGALGAGAIASEAGQAAFFESLANGATSTEALNTALGIESLASGTASYMTPELMGPTYGELGITGVEGGFAGPTYAEMGYTGLNQGQAIAAADAAAKGMSASEILSNANRVRSGANTLAKLLGGGNTTTGTTGGGATGGTTGTTSSGFNTQQLASLLGSGLPTQVAPGGIYRMNQNPFSFGDQAQKPISPNTYDLSGTNAMANSLRNYKA